MWTKRSMVGHQRAMELIIITYWGKEKMSEVHCIARKEERKENIKIKIAEANLRNDQQDIWAESSIVGWKRERKLIIITCWGKKKMRTRIMSEEKEKKQYHWKRLYKTVKLNLNQLDTKRLNPDVFKSLWILFFWF